MKHFCGISRTVSVVSYTGRRCCVQAFQAPAFRRSGSEHPARHRPSPGHARVGVRGAGPGPRQAHPVVHWRAPVEATFPRRDRDNENLMDGARCRALILRACPLRPSSGLAACAGPLATLSCEPRQARKGAAAAVMRAPGCGWCRPPLDFEPVAERATVGAGLPANRHEGSRAYPKGHKSPVLQVTPDSISKL